MNRLTCYGVALMILAVVVGCVGAMIGSSVSTYGSGEVFNLSRAHHQTIVFGGAAVSWLSGIILLGFGRLVPKPSATMLTPDNRKLCPYCSQPIDDDAARCPNCLSRLAWLEGEPLTQQQLAEEAAGIRTPKASLR